MVQITPSLCICRPHIHFEATTRRSFFNFYANDVGKFSDNIFNLFIKEEISIFNNKYPPLKTKEGYSELFDKIQSLEKDSPSFFIRMRNSF